MFSLPSVISHSSLVKRLLFSNKVNINHGNSFAKQKQLAAFHEEIELTTGPPKLQSLSLQEGGGSTKSSLKPKSRLRMTIWLVATKTFCTYAGTCSTDANTGSGCTFSQVLFPSERKKNDVEEEISRHL